MRYLCLNIYTNQQTAFNFHIEIKTKKKNKDLSVGICIYVI